MSQNEHKPENGSLGEQTYDDYESSPGGNHIFCVGCRYGSPLLLALPFSTFLLHARPCSAGKATARNGTQPLLSRCLHYTRGGVRISQCCHNKLPQTGQLSPTEMYFTTVLARSPKSRGRRGHAPFKGSGGLPWLWLLMASASMFTWPFPVCLLPPLLLGRHIIGVRTHPDNPGQAHLKILNLII